MNFGLCGSIIKSLMTSFSEGVYYHDLIMNQSKELLGRHLTWSMLKKRVSGLNTKGPFVIQ
jgi:hypothetical protein